MMPCNDAGDSPVDRRPDARGDAPAASPTGAPAATPADPPQDPFQDPPDRGDVPGWVLITMMTAGLVVMLWALAGDALSDMFQAAMARVSNVSGG